MTLLFAKLAELTKSKKYIFFIITILSLVAGLRHETVGLDTKGYVDAIENIANGRLDLAYGMEWSFRYICYALSFVTKNPQVFMLIFAVITNALIVLRLWDLKDQISFTVAIFAYYTVFYMTSLNLTRQFISVAIVFYATRYLLQGKNIRYLISVFVASLFHTTALLGVVYVYFNVFNWRELSKRHKWFLVVACFLMPIALILVYRNLVYYSSYLDKQSVDVGLMTIIKTVLLIVTIVFYDKSKTENVEGVAKTMRFVICAYVIGLALTSLGYVFRFVDRMGLYFYVYEAVYIGYLFKQRNTRINFMIKILYGVLFVYLFIGSTTGNGQGQFPYLFYWQ